MRRPRAPDDADSTYELAESTKDGETNYTFGQPAGAYPVVSKAAPDDKESGKTTDSILVKYEVNMTFAERD